jgi:ribosome-binding factor A
MDSKRQQKFSRLIQKELSDIFISNAKHLFGGAFITITMVKSTPDLGIARVYISLMMVQDKNQMLEQIRQNTKQIRQQLSARIGKQTRVVPDLQFFLDDSAEYAEKMNQIFSDLNIPKGETPKEGNENN